MNKKNITKAFVLISLLFLKKSIAQSNLEIYKSATTITSRFTLPDGYSRKIADKNSFQYFLSNFPLHPYATKVYYYDGRLKPNPSVYVSVLNIDIGKTDLQQCADAVMRLRAEYLYKQKYFDKIHFNLTNGMRVDYIKWAKGNRIQVNGNKTSWYKKTSENYSYPVFKTYLEFIFTYAGTLSLSKELKSIPIDSVEIGDVFIKGGSPGHAVLVIDVATNKWNGKKIIALAQSYMPAQSIHILANKLEPSHSPWYDLSKYDKLYTPEWIFEKTELKRFLNN